MDFLSKENLKVFAAVNNFTLKKKTKRKITLAIELNFFNFPNGHYFYCIKHMDVVQPTT